eukprot:1383900-Prymnesium_polylepis.1
MRKQLHCATVKIISLHQLPKVHAVTRISHLCLSSSPQLERTEQRPRFDGSRGACHQFVQELSGRATAPGSDEPSCPAVKLTLHPVGGPRAPRGAIDAVQHSTVRGRVCLCTFSSVAGFCALCKVLPLPKDQQLIETESGTATVAGNGMNAQFGETVHCMAAEPQAVFLRVCVVDRGQEVAYETSCLGRLRVGYRVLNLRSMLGTRIELCHLLVCISFRHEPFSWATARQ